MKFTIAREVLLRPLSVLQGVVPRRHTLPILSHLRLEINGQELILTGLDLEVELTWRVNLDTVMQAGTITVPAKKLADICRSLSEGSILEFALEEHRAVVRSGRSRFVLTTLPAADFPSIEVSPIQHQINLPQKQLLNLIQRTDFAMAKQDVRFYLNGMLFELSTGRLRCVATDGHRLALVNLNLDTPELEKTSMIVPAKAVIDLVKLLDESDEPVSLLFGEKHFQVNLGNATFVSKHIEGKYPDYEQVIPRAADKLIVCNRLEFRQMLSRISILANEKLNGIHLQLSDDNLTLIAKNTEQEEAEANLAINYRGESLEIGFNVGYLIDVMDNLGSGHEEVQLNLSDPASSSLIHAVNSQDALYVVMPMRI